MKSYAFGTVNNAQYFQNRLRVLFLSICISSHHHHIFFELNGDSCSQMVVYSDGGCSQMVV